MAKKKSSAKKKKTAKKKPAYRKKSVTKKKPVAKKKSAAKKAARGKKKSTTRGRQQTTYPVRAIGRSRRDSGAGGQSGDTQGLSRHEDEDSESVAELTEEGQYFEAEAVSGVENAKDPDEGEVRTREVPEDDVPEEYTDRENDV